MTTFSTKGLATFLLGIPGLTLTMNGCSTTAVTHDYCSIAKPIYLAKGEAAKLSDATARAILTNNETYVKVCNASPKP